jgi:hypothetical protein
MADILLSEKFWVWFFRVTPPVLTFVVATIVGYFLLWGDSTYVRQDKLENYFKTFHATSIEPRLSRLEGETKNLSGQLDSNISQLRYDLRDTVQELRKTNDRLNKIIEQNGHR